MVPKWGRNTADHVVSALMETNIFSLSASLILGTFGKRKISG